MLGSHGRGWGPPAGRVQERCPWRALWTSPGLASAGARTTREPPGSTGVASVTQAPLESGAAVGGRKAQGALFRSLPSGAGDPGRGAAGVPGW